MTARGTRSRRGATALALASIVALLVGCGGDEPMHVQITSSTYNGLHPESGGKSATVGVDAVEGESTVLDPHFGDGVTATITSVDGDEVELSTSTDLLSEEGDSLTTEFTVKQGPGVTFSTPTMDAGTRWTATLKDGPAPS